MVTKIVDSMMGTGKTSAAIRYMQEHPEERFIYLTPYLDEVQRVKAACDFREPEIGNGTNRKIDAFCQMLWAGDSIVSTHALFQRLSDRELEMIRARGYILVLDESVNLVQTKGISKQDLDDMKKLGLISHDEETDAVTWLKPDYSGAFNDYKKIINSHYTTLVGAAFLFWEHPVSMFESFKEVFVLTYLFDCQMQGYYYKANHLEFEYIHVERDETGYCFVAGRGEDYRPELLELIHIMDRKKLNQIGDDWHALSVRWFENAKQQRGRPKIETLRKNITNVFTNIYTKASADARLWTTWKEYATLLRGNGYTKAFLSFNARSTNEYANRTALCYCVNVFMNPYVKQYFLRRGVEVKEEEYALAEMLQWLWRSAIRKGQKIYCYIPSYRMRSLLQAWLCHLSGGGTLEECIGRIEQKPVQQPVKRRKGAATKKTASGVA